MSQLQLLEKYSHSLELENQAKLSQIQALYLQIDSLSQLNHHIQTQLNIHISNNAHMQITITQLQQHLQLLQVQLQQKQAKLQQKETQQHNQQQQQVEEQEQWPQEEEVSNCQQKEQQDQCGIMYCQKCQQYEKQYTNLYNEYLLKQSQLQQYENIQNNTQIQQLIENYEQVQQIAKEKMKQNEIQQKHIQHLEEQIEIYKQQIFSKDNEIKILGQKIFVKQNRPSLTPRISQFDLSLNQIELVKQNNRLIQKNVELEKYKNSSLIGETNSSRQSRYFPSLSPLRTGTTKNNGHFIGTSIRKQIQKLKCQNSIILESLRI